MKLQGKVALITGASRGIGASIAKRFAAEGAKVVVNYRSSSEKAAALVNEIAALGGTATAIQADISKPADVKNLVDQTVQAFNQVDILVNNAGWGALKPLSEITFDLIKSHFDLNVVGLIFATQQAAQHMPSGGRIINISSIAAKGGPTGGVYSASKAAVNALTKSFAGDLGPQGITVNAIAPGATVTDLYDEVGLADHEEAIIADTPLGRVGQPEDIAGAALFLASEDASFITGEILQVSGGRAM
ncbi:MAG: 3-oxoacyl-ACP reductase family protein [Chloroflexota bacterium]